MPVVFENDFNWDGVDYDSTVGPPVTTTDPGSTNRSNIYLTGTSSGYSQPYMQAATNISLSNQEFLIEGFVYPKTAPASADNANTVILSNINGSNPYTGFYIFSHLTQGVGTMFYNNSGTSAASISTTGNYLPINTWSYFCIYRIKGASDDTIWVKHGRLSAGVTEHSASTTVASNLSFLPANNGLYFGAPGFSPGSSAFHFTGNYERFKITVGNSEVLLPNNASAITIPALPKLGIVSGSDPTGNTGYFYDTDSGNHFLETHDVLPSNIYISDSSIFCIEFWFKLLSPDAQAGSSGTTVAYSSTMTACIFATGEINPYGTQSTGAIQVGVIDGATQVNFSVSNGYRVVIDSTPVLDTWIHLAIIRTGLDGAYVGVWKDGIYKTKINCSTLSPISATINRLFIGGIRVSNVIKARADINFCDLRIVTGCQPYVGANGYGNFTPPTTRLQG